MSLREGADAVRELARRGAVARTAAVGRHLAEVLDLAADLDDDDMLPASLRHALERISVLATEARRIVAADAAEEDT